MVTSHPPKVPYPLCDIHPFIHSVAACLTTFPVPNNKAWKGTPFLQASNPSGQPQKGSRPGFGPKRLFPSDPRRHFQLPACKPPKSQNVAPKRLLVRIWPKTAVSQGSQKAPLIAGLQATKVSKSGSKTAPGQDLTQNGCFLMIPEGTFNCRPGRRGQDWAKTAVSH